MPEHLRPFIDVRRKAIRTSSPPDPARPAAHESPFYISVPAKKSEGIRLAVMDMRKPFRNVTAERAPKAAILFDKFHIMRHLSDALDEVRKSEYARLSGRQRRFLKGQKYTLLSRRENLSLSGTQALNALLKANKRLNTAYMLKESFGQPWDYEHEGWARKFFDNWRASLKWRLATLATLGCQNDPHKNPMKLFLKLTERAPSRHRPQIPPSKRSVASASDTTYRGT
jgi:transposase